MQRKATIVLASVAILLCLGWFYYRLKPVAGQFDSTLSTGMGVALAEETVKAAHDQGEVVTIFYGDPAHPGTLKDDRLAAFQAELNKHKSIRLVPPELVQPNPNENNGLPGCPPTAFNDILRRHSNAAVIVFFVDLPDWRLVGSELPKTEGPKLIALLGGGNQIKVRYSGYFGSGRLAALIVPRRELGTGPADLPQARFASYYQIVTAQNIDAQPD